MACGMCSSTFKLFIISAIVLYTSYLYSYKCESVSTLETILHPMNSHHQSLCKYVYKSEEILTPYGHKLHGFLDDHVHSTQVFQKYDLHGKMVRGIDAGYSFIKPALFELYKLIEVLEVKGYDYAVIGYNHLVQLYHDKVAPKLA